MPRVNFTEVADSGRAPLPAGSYVVCCIGVQQKVNNAGDEQWNVKWEVQEGAFKGRWIFDTLTFSPAAMWRVKMLYGHLLGRSGDNEDCQLEDLADVCAVAKVILDEWPKGSGKMRNRIEDYRPSSAAQKPSQRDEPPTPEIDFVPDDCPI